MTDDDKALAGEYVLRLLSSAEEAQARARLATDRAFADEVAAWEERLHPMTDGGDEAPSDLLWPKIAAQVAAPVQDNSKGPLRLWQGISVAATAAALVLGIMLFNQPAPLAPDQPLIAALGSDQGRASMTASYDRQTGMLTLTPVLLDTGQLYPELWVIPADGTARSLGMVTRDRPSQVRVTPDMRVYLERGATLAITPEPEGGAPAL
jgi:anti-sigma-K factor RskA